MNAARQGALAAQVMALDHCLLLVRHGATAWNAQDRLTTRTDIPLTALGHKQGRVLARSLQGARFDSARSSPLARARATADYATANLLAPVPVIMDARLCEPDAGPFEGMAYAQLRGDTVIAQHYAAYARENDPVYPAGACSHEQTAEHVRALLDEIVAVPGRHLAISHGALLRQLTCVFLGQNPCFYRRLKLDNCHGVLLRFYPQPPHQLVGFNLSPGN